MESENQIPVHLIAPCGMNCALCMAFQRKRDSCPGCRIEDYSKPETRSNCAIRICKERNENEFCSSCSVFPCKRLIRIDRRYQSKYEMSFIDNLTRISTTSLEQFLISESKRWSCPACGSLICVHKKKCLNCRK